MALHILKDNALTPNFSSLYTRYATVESFRATGLKKFFGPKPGTARLARGRTETRPIIQVMPPVWKDGEGDERSLLEACYRAALATASFHHCQALVIPLLTGGDPNFPVWIDYKIAVDTIEGYLSTQSLEVHLIASRPAAFRMPELRADVERFLSRNFFEEDLLWSSRSFSDYDSRFATLTPEPMESGFSMDYSASYGECEASPCEVYESFEPCQAAPCPPSSGFSRDTGALPIIPDLPELDAGFSETLLALIDKTGKKDSEIYNKANVSRQHFSKIRNNPNYKPTKPTAVAFAIALELDMEQTLDLIGRAGYTLTRSSRFDVIIMYFIERQNYNMFDINDTLYEFDQSLLGA